MRFQHQHEVFLLSSKVIDFPPEWRARGVFQAINSMLISQHSRYERKSRQFSFPSQESTSGSLNVIASVVAVPPTLSSHPARRRTFERKKSAMKSSTLFNTWSLSETLIKSHRRKKEREKSASRRRQRSQREKCKKILSVLAFSSPLRRTFFTEPKWWQSFQPLCWGEESFFALRELNDD